MEDTLEEWIAEALSHHNRLRGLHAAQKLRWSEECYNLAKLQAEECHAQGRLVVGNHIMGESGRHGQNVFQADGEARARPKTAVETWYDQGMDYDFSRPKLTLRMAQFTQLLWAGTSSVGLAVSPDGKFIVANYLPAGNIGSSLEKNVLRSKKERIGLVVPPEVEKTGILFAGVPPQAIVVRKVVSGSWADENGIRPGDCIVQFNGIAVSTLTSETFRSLMSERPLSLKFPPDEEKWAVKRLQGAARMFMAKAKVHRRRSQKEREGRMKDRGMTRENIVIALFQRLDVDKDGRLSEAEMLRYGQSLDVLESDDEWHEVYQEFVTFYGWGDLGFADRAGFQKLVDDEEHYWGNTTDQLFTLLETLEFEASLKPRPGRRGDVGRGVQELVCGLKVKKIGMVLSMPPHAVSVKKVIDGGWADERGIEIGDTFVEINGIPVYTMTRQQFEHQLRQRPLRLRLASEDQIKAAIMVQKVARGKFARHDVEDLKKERAAQQKHDKVTADVFKALDTDKSGFLHKLEMLYLVRHLGFIEEDQEWFDEWPEIVEKYALDADRGMSYEHFRDLIQDAEGDWYCNVESLRIVLKMHNEAYAATRIQAIHRGKTARKMKTQKVKQKEEQKAAEEVKKQQEAKDAEAQKETEQKEAEAQKEREQKEAEAQKEREQKEAEAQKEKERKETLEAARRAAEEQEAEDERIAAEEERKAAEEAEKAAKEQAARELLEAELARKAADEARKVAEEERRKAEEHRQAEELRTLRKHQGWLQACEIDVVRLLKQSTGIEKKAFGATDVQYLVDLLESEDPMNPPEEQIHPWVENPKTLGALAAFMLAILASKDPTEGKMPVKEAISKAGAIQSLVNFYLRADDQQDRVQIAVVALRWLTAGCFQAAKEAYREGAMALLLECLDSPTDGMRAAAAKALRNICMESEEYRSNFMFFGGMVALVEHLNPEADPVLNHTLEAVANFQDMIRDRSGYLIPKYVLYAVENEAKERLGQLALSSDADVRKAAADCLDIIIEVEKAATAIQKAVRGKQERKVVKKKKEEQQRKIREDAASTKLQSAERGRKARQEVKEMKEKRKEAAIRVQSAERARQARREVEQTRRDNEQRAEAQQKAAVKIQSIERGNKARKEVQNMKDQHAKAATQIQSMQRGRQVRLETDKAIEERRKAATKLQSTRRGQMGRKKAAAKAQLKKDREWQANDTDWQAASKIQARYRGNQARKDVDRLKKEKIRDHEEYLLCMAEAAGLEKESIETSPECAELPAALTITGLDVELLQANKNLMTEVLQNIRKSIAQRARVPENRIQVGLTKQRDQRRRSRSPAGSTR